MLRVGALFYKKTAIGETFFGGFFVGAIRPAGYTGFPAPKARICGSVESFYERP